MTDGDLNGITRAGQSYRDACDGARSHELDDDDCAGGGDVDDGGICGIGCDRDDGYAQGDSLDDVGSHDDRYAIGYDPPNRCLARLKRPP